MTLPHDIFEPWSSSVLVLQSSFSSAVILLQAEACENLQLSTRRFAMACSPSRAFAYDGEADLTLADISSSEGWVASYSDLTTPNPTSSMATLAWGWEVDATINPALLAQPSVSSDISTYGTPMQQP